MQNLAMLKLKYALKCSRIQTNKNRSSIYEGMSFVSEWHVARTDRQYLLTQTQARATPCRDDAEQAAGPHQQGIWFIGRPQLPARGSACKKDIGSESWRLPLPVYPEYTSGPSV